MPSTSQPASRSSSSRATRTSTGSRPTGTTGPPERRGQLELVQEHLLAFYSWAAPKPQPLAGRGDRRPGEQSGDKAAWIADMGDHVKTLYPEIKAVVYFDAYATANFGGWYDFRVDTSASSYAGVPDPGERSVLQLADVRGRRRSADGPGQPHCVGGRLAGRSVAGPRRATTIGVQGYDVYRDGTMVGTVPSTSYADVAVSPGGTYVVRRPELATASATPPALCNAVSATVPRWGPPPAFSDGFESGSMGAWRLRLTRETPGSAAPSRERYAAQAATTGAFGTYAVKTLRVPQPELYARTYFKVVEPIEHDESAQAADPDRRQHLHPLREQDRGAHVPQRRPSHGRMEPDEREQERLAPGADPREGRGRPARPRSGSTVSPSRDSASPRTSGPRGSAG